MAVIYFTSQGSLYYLIFGATAFISLAVGYFGLCVMGDSEVHADQLRRIIDLTEEMQGDIERIKDFQC